ncbi:MAG: hypothetical protein RIS64_727, partial [Bacteroidota bacterium]
SFQLKINELGNEIIPKQHLSRGYFGPFKTKNRWNIGYQTLRERDRWVKNTDIKQLCMQLF